MLSMHVAHISHNLSKYILPGKSSMPEQEPCASADALSGVTLVPIQQRFPGQKNRQYDACGRSQLCIR